jgi:hypothetical protein
MNLFDQELRRNIAKTIQKLRKEGTVAMSLDNLRQVTPTPLTTNGAPVGGNVPWQYAQRFEAVVKSEAAFVKFTNV